MSKHSSVEVGGRYGLLEVVSRHSCSRNGHIKWLCKCSCGAEKVVFGTHLVQGNSKSCGCDRPRYGPRHVQWTGCGDISGNFFNQIRRGADGSKGRDPIPFSLTVEYLWDLFLQQGRCCALTGLPLTFARYQGINGNPQTASLDRIDSSRAYEAGNVQWVHKDINRMKNSFTQAHFVAMCARVAAHARGTRAVVEENADAEAK